MNIIRERNASAFLLLNAVLWGSSYIWSKMLLSWLPYFTILFVFSLAGLIALSAIFFRRLKGMSWKTMLVGLGIGCFSILSNICCMLALESTSSSNTAFIVQLSVIITPLLMSVYRRALPGGRTVLSAVAAIAGLFLLTCDFEHFRFNPGDLFALGNAVFFSLYLVALKIYSGRTDPVQFTFVQHAESTLVFLALVVLFETQIIRYAVLDAKVLLILALSAAISVATILIQSTAIRYVRPEKAAIIYTLEPVTAAVLAFFLAGERLVGFNALAGCALILFAVLCTVNVKQSGSTQMKRNKVEYNYLESSIAIQKRVNAGNDLRRKEA